MNKNQEKLLYSLCSPNSDIEEIIIALVGKYGICEIVQGQENGVSIRLDGMTIFVSVKELNWNSYKVFNWQLGKKLFFQSNRVKLELYDLFFN